tara:strand:+ start:22116 stop:22955 length:840 start_codon:yes stop_codon:yes gene_type:complete
MSLYKNLKIRFKTASIVQQLIYINVIVFIFILISNSFSGLYGKQMSFIYDWFSLSSSIDTFMSRPWSVISYGFLHNGFFHIFFNCIVLNYFGRLFIEYFTQKQLLNFYLLGTFFGGLAYLISYAYFPLFEDKIHTMVGASAGITAIVIGTATYIPNYKLQFRFIGYVKVWHLAGIIILFDLVSLSGGNGGGHIAHLGGALFGYFYVYRAGNKPLNLFEWLSGLLRKTTLQTVYNSSKRKTKKNSSDIQTKIDSILDKISKSGYDTLTKEEKEFLFKQGK